MVQASQSFPSQIGPYVVEHEIGRGGMGVVYLARDQRLDRAVAIKALPEHVAIDADRLARFEREAKTLAQVSHGNIAGIHGLEEQDGRRYLVLEYVEGETLADRLDRGALPVDDALEVMIQVARGLGAAHDAGVVHRDLKPANIRITPDGRVKLLDFGLARAEEGSASSSSESPTLTSPIQHSPTIPGAILGTAPYMSPEQARGRRVDKRTDIWSFGAVLYECIVGASPFRGETATDSIGAILHKEVDLDRLPEGAPESLRRLLRRCLTRSRDERLHDIHDARLDLEGAIAELAVRTEASMPWRVDWRNAWPGVVGMSMLAALGGALVTYAMVVDPEATPPLTPARVSIAAPPAMEFSWIELAPDGRTAAVMVRETDSRDSFSWFLRSLDSHDMKPVPGSAGAESGEFSPDGRWFAFSAPVQPGSTTFRLMKMELGSGLPPVEVTLLPARFTSADFSFEWLTDNEALFIDGLDHHVRMIDMASGAIGERIELDRGTYKGRIFWTTGEVDATRVLCGAFHYTDRGYQEDIALIDISERTLTPLIENAGQGRLAPDGSLLHTRIDTLFSAAFDMTTLDVGASVQLASGLRAWAPWSHAAFAVSRNGTIAYLPGGVQAARRRIVFMSPDGDVDSWGGDPRTYMESVAVSRDGSRLAVTVGAGTGLYELWVSEVETPRLRRLRASPEYDARDAVFTPDGESIIYAVHGTDTQWLESMPFNGSAEPIKLMEPTEDFGYPIPMSVHPDGGRVLVVLRGYSGARLVEFPTDGSGPMVTLFPSGSSQGWGGYSPDGSMLAYVSDETGRIEAYVRSIQPGGTFGPAIPVTQRGASAAMWRPAPLESGQAFTLQVTTTNGVFDYPVAPGERPVVGEAVRTGYDLSIEEVGRGCLLADGRYVAIARGEEEAPATHAELILFAYDGTTRRLGSR